MSVPAVEKETASATESVRWQGVAFAALHHRDYRSYFVTTMLTMMADNVEHVISYWVMFQAFHSTLLAGFAVISHWVPFLLLSVHSGILADRFDCRKLLQISQVMFLSVSVCWGVLFLTGTLQPWHAVVLLIVHGLSGTVWGPPGQLIIHDMIGGEQLQSGVRLVATARNLGILLGPAIGGGLMLVFGPAIGLLVNALIYVPMIVWAQLVPYTGHAEAGRAGGSVRRLGVLDAVKALQEVAGNRTIVAMVALGGLTSLLIGNGFQAQMPEYAQALGPDDSGFMYTALLVANAAGAVIGGLVLEWAGVLGVGARAAVVLAMLWCGAMAAFAATSSYFVAVVMLFIAGFLQLAFSTMAQTIVQLLAPPHLRGRVVGLFNMSSNGLRFGAGITLGVFGLVIGIHWALVLSAIVLFAITIGILAFMMARTGETSPSAA